jgi:hypothetical protein
MAGARQEDVNNAMLSILRKMDVMLESTEITYEKSLTILGNIEGVLQDDLGAELKKQTKILMNIETKIEKLGQAGGGSSGGGGGGESGGGFMKAVGEIPKILMDMIKVLAVAGLLTDLLVDGAVAIVDSIKALLRLAEGVNPATAALSMLYFKGLSIIKFGEIAENLKKFANIKVFIGALMLPVIGKALLYFADGLPILFYLSLINGKKVGETLTGLGDGLRAIADALIDSLMKTGPLFGIGILIRAYVVSKAVQFLLSSSIGVKPMDALLSVAYFKLLSISGLGDLTAALNQSIGFSLFGDALVKRAKSLREAVRVLLSTGSQNSIKSGLFGSIEPVSPMDALLSAAYFFILGHANLKELTDSLSGSIAGRLFGDPLVKRAKSLREAVRILLSTSQGIDIKEAIISVVMLYFTGLAISKLVSNLAAAAVLAPLVMVGVKVMQFSIKSMLKAVNSVAADAPTLIASGIYLVLLSSAIGGILFISVVAALVAPLVLVGSMIVRFAVKTLIIAAEQMKKLNEKQLVSKTDALVLVITALVGLLGIMIASKALKDIGGTMMSIGVFAAGIFTLGLVTIILAKMMKKLDVTKLDLFSIAVTNMMNALTLVIMAKALKDAGGSLTQVGMFGAMLFILGAITIGLSYLMKKIEIKKIDMFALALSNLVQALSMILISEAMKNPPKSFKDVILFGLMMTILSLNMVLISRLMGKGTSTAKLMGMIIFIAGLILLTQMVVFFARDVGISALGDVIIFSLLVLAVAFTAIFISKKISANVGKMLKAVLVMALWVVAMVLVGMAVRAFASSVKARDVAIVIGTIALLGITFFLIGKKWKDIAKGALMGVALAIVVWALGLAVGEFKKADVGWEDLAKLAATITGLGIAAYVIGKKAVDVAKGAGVLVILGIVLIEFSVGLLIFSKATKNLTWESLAMMAGVITFLALIGTVLGIPPIVGFAAAGAGVLVLLGAAFAVFSTGFLIFAKAISMLDKEDPEIMGEAIKAVGGSLASIGWEAPFILLGAAAMIPAALALLPLAGGMLLFKKAGFTKEDGENVEFMVGSVVRAFGIVTDYERQKKMGFYVNPTDLFLGIAALSGAGRVLAGLAEGVQAWANLEVNEWEVVNGGTKDAKLVIKGRRKLSKSDFDNAAHGMGQVISAIAEPFAKVGRLEKGQPSGNPLLDAVFGGGFVSAGVEALERSGSTLVSLAQGVESFANMNIIEFEVVGAGTKDAKLVPKGIKKISPNQLEDAGRNIASIISVVGQAFADIGRQEKNSEGLFSGGYVTKGVKAMDKVGQNLKAITDSVLSLANRQVPQMQLINAGTADAKLVPGEPLIIKDDDLTNAANTIMDIVGVVANRFYDIGKMEEESSGWFSGGYISKGIKSLAGLGSNVSAITDAVLKFAKGEIQPMTLVNAGTPEAKLVPGQPMKISPTMLKSAGKTIGDVISIIGKEVNSFGKWLDENKTYIDVAVAKMPGITAIVTDATKPLEAWAKITDSDKTTKIITSYFDALKDVFDPSKNKNLEKSSIYFTQFATNVEKVSIQADKFTKVADNFERIQKSMQVFKTHVNGLDLKKLTLTDSLFNAIAAMSKNPDAIANSIAKSMNKSFEALIKALKDLAAANTPAVAAPSASTGTGNTNTGTTNRPGTSNTPSTSTGAVRDPGGSTQRVYVVNGPAGWR